LKMDFKINYHFRVLPELTATAILQPILLLYAQKNCF
jgi:hypothetical protein